MPGPIKYLAFGLIVIAALGFLGGIILAGYYTLWIDGAPQPTQMPKFVADFVTSAGRCSART